MASRNDDDLSWYEKNRGNDHVIKTAEFRSAKKIEEEALMAALGLQIIPPASTSQSRPVIKREPQSTSVKNEPMTPAVHHDSRKSKNDKHRREDRRRQRQMKTTGSDEEKHNWSENDDEEDLMDEAYDNDESKRSLQQNMSTEKELDEFLLDLINKHGLRTIKHALKSKKEKIDQSSSSDSEDERQKSHKKHKHKSKHSHREDSRSSKRHRSRSSSPARDRSKRRHDR